MNKLSTYDIIALFIGICIIAPAGSISIQKEHLSNEAHFENTLYVDDDNINGPWDGTPDHPYQYIQQGINNSLPGGTIYVSCGTYYENIVIEKNLTLTGANSSTVIIDGGYEGFVVKVIEDDVSINNFTIRKSGGYNGDAGILLNSNDNLIKNCIIYRTNTCPIVTNDAIYNINI